MMREFKHCELCGEPILPGDRVSVVTFNGEQVHHECGFRSAMGGANHQRRTCPCFGGTDEPDPPGLTPRDAARAALAAYYEMGGPGA